MKQQNTKMVLFALLAGNLVLGAWNVINLSPEPAQAQVDPDTSSPKTGIPNAGAQRKEIKQALESIDATNKRLLRLLESGQAKVQVENLDEIKLD